MGEVQRVVHTHMRTWDAKCMTTSVMHLVLCPARSRTSSVLNLLPSERYVSTALSSIPISLHRNVSRLPSL